MDAYVLFNTMSYSQLFVKKKFSISNSANSTLRLQETSTLPQVSYSAPRQGESTYTNLNAREKRIVLDYQNHHFEVAHTVPRLANLTFRKNIK